MAALAKFGLMSPPPRRDCGKTTMDDLFRLFFCCHRAPKPLRPHPPPRQAIIAASQHHSNRDNRGSNAHLYPPIFHQGGEGGDNGNNDSTPSSTSMQSSLTAVAAMMATQEPKRRRSTMPSVAASVLSVDQKNNQQTTGTRGYGGATHVKDDG